MASPSASSVLLVLVVAFTAGANAATFTITNQCSYTVWPATIPVGGGQQLDPGQTWTIDIPAGTCSGRIWGRTGCSFNGDSGSCQTGDCAGALSYTAAPHFLPTAAICLEFTIGGAGDNTDIYSLSVIDGLNVPMSFPCSTGDTLRFYADKCPDAYLFPTDDTKLHHCSGNSNYEIIFCPPPQ